jgi:ribonuclease E
MSNRPRRDGSPSVARGTRDFDATLPPTAAAEPVAAAHWTNSGAGGAPKTVEAAAVNVPAEVPASTAAAEAAVDADDLDAALAEQAEQLEESSRAAEAPAPATVPAEAPPVSEAEAAAQAGEQPLAVVPAEAHSTASTAAVPAETAHVTQHSTVTATANKTTTAAAHATVRTDANAPVVVPEAKPTKPPAPAKPSLWARVRAPMDRLGNVLATPLAMLPESARDIVAYLAAVTVFNAMAVWTYMLFIYTPAVAPPAHDAPALHATEPVPQTHGEHGDGHAPAGHGGGEHCAAKAEGHAKTSEDGHGEKAAPAHEPEHEAKPGHGAESPEAAHDEGAGHGAPHEAAPH